VSITIRKFQLGKLVATPEALKALEQAGQGPGGIAPPIESL